MPFSIIRRELTESGRAVVVSSMVEDLRSTMSMLEVFGLIVECLTNAESAVQFATENKFDLLVVAHEMPGKISTPMLVSLLRESHPYLAVVQTVPRFASEPKQDLGVVLKTPFTILGLFVAVGVALRVEREKQKLVDRCRDVIVDRNLLSN